MRHEESILGTPLTRDQEDDIAEMRALGDYETADTYDLFCRGWNAAGND